MPITLDDYILGESNETIRIDSSQDCSEAVLALTRQANRSLSIFTHKLDRRVYNSLDIYSAALKLASRSRHSQIRIIIKDTTDVVKRGSRLVELGHRLSSRVQFRTPPTEYRDFNEEFVIVDEIGLLHRRLASRYDADLSFCEPKNSRQLQKYFDECWEKSAQDPNLRQLHL
ncbi:MAG TPA: hypothetical protein ENJ65_00305 [Candidatus Tenderia electrophaga]|uniref:DUF7931 domain-containing protein n=1 Tax=Candidatus Tenderia electrophaga TaxID=1748243 RepID=A0A832J2C8_9GAMM|nr:hypothetical protein [Candidatus Tenderia electrophaga]